MKIKILLYIFLLLAAVFLAFYFFSKSKTSPAVAISPTSAGQIAFSKKHSANAKAFAALKKDEVRTMPRGQGAKNIRKCSDTNLVIADIHSLESEIKGFKVRHSETGNFIFGDFIRQNPKSCDQLVKNCEARLHGSLHFFISSDLLIREETCPNGIPQITHQLVRLESICLDGIDYLTGALKKEPPQTLPEPCPDINSIPKIK